MEQPVTAILGLGREVGDAVARRFSEQGHRVVAADPRVKRLEGARASLSDKVVLHHSELHTRLGLRNVMSAADEAFGRINNIVVIPEISESDALVELSIEKFDKAMASSVRAAVLLLSAFSDRLAQLSDEDIDRPSQQGTVTFILDYLAKGAMPGQFTASVTQSAILSVVRAGALELAERGIRVNAIAAIRPRELRTQEFTTARTPLGRAALADEIADAARFLSSPEAAFITGETLTLDGGRSTLSGILS
ncbi:MAG: SDR family NAD(P)-dependent oxidoreductase [Hyphomonas sp.]